MAYSTEELLEQHRGLCIKARRLQALIIASPKGNNDAVRQELLTIYPAIDALEVKLGIRKENK